MKKTILIFLLLPFVSIHAQHPPGSPTYHRGFGGAALYLQGGYQKLIFPNETSNAYNISVEVKYDGFIAWNRMSVIFNNNYISFNPFSIISFMPLLKMIVSEDGIHTYNLQSGMVYHGPRIIILALNVLAFSSRQYKFSLSNHLELTTGWEYLRLTKMKKDSPYYLTGNLNAGLTCFLGDNLFMSLFYEYNYNHNVIVKALDWTLRTCGFGQMNEQPNELKGHSYGIRVGWMF